MIAECQDVPRRKIAADLWLLLKMTLEPPAHFLDGPFAGLVAAQAFYDEPNGLIDVDGGCHPSGRRY